MLTPVSWLADDVGDEVVDEICVTLAQLFLTNGDLNVRERFDIAIVLRSSSQLLRDDIFVDHELVAFHLLADVREELVETEHDLFSLLVAENLIEHKVADALRERTPVTSDHIETLDLARYLFFRRAPVLDLQRCILLFLEEQ